ncbi:MAG: serine/threonine protein kinase [Bdellovibrionota bacterium]
MKDSFYTLSPDTVLNVVEKALNKRYPGTQATGKAFALNSLENRVFEIELESEIHSDLSSEKSVVVKFYRPGRWTRSEILEEHRFIEELNNAEVPAVAALTELEETPDGISFIVFPKIRGRLKDELQADELRQLGRLLARLHSVGERFDSTKNRFLNLKTFGEDSLNFLKNSNFMDSNTLARYSSLCEEIFKMIKTPLAEAPSQVVHGDCHVGNILWNESGPFFLDFDDMLSAPPVQDIWMVVKGRDAEDLEMRDELIQGYEEMKDFDRSTLSLVEPLRALRMIHYSAWIAKRWQDPSFQQMFSHFTSPAYWSEEMQALDEILSILRYGPNFAQEY